MPRWTLLALCAMSAACARGGDGGEEDALPSGPDGVYDVTAAPPAQMCGAAMVTFTTPQVYFFEIGMDDSDGYQTAVLFGGTILDGTTVSVEGDGHFEATWTTERSDPVPCPATGHSNVTTTFVNVWVGDGDAFGFQSLLFQEMDTDCDTSSCFMTWNLTGAPPGG